MYKYILFDFDGTIVDTNELIVLALRETAKKYLCRDLTTEDLNSILGKYLEDQMRLLSEEHYMEMVLFYKEFYKARQDSMVTEFPGVTDMLRKLRQAGIKTAVVSAKGRGGILHGLEKFNMQDCFDVIISAYDIRNNKPHPEPAIKAMEALGAKEEDTLLLGDSPYDILCGKNAGTKTALVDWTIFPKEELLKLQPDHYIKTPKDLLEIVLC